MKKTLAVKGTGASNWHTLVVALVGTYGNVKLVSDDVFGSGANTVATVTLAGDETDIEAIEELTSRTKGVEKYEPRSVEPQITTVQRAGANLRRWHALILRLAGADECIEVVSNEYHEPGMNPMSHQVVIELRGDPQKIATLVQTADRIGDIKDPTVETDSDE